MSTITRSARVAPGPRPIVALAVAFAAVVSTCGGPDGASGPAVTPTPAIATATATAMATATAPADSLAVSPGRVEAIGHLAITRAAHSATRLPDGRVLVAGGCTTASCEGVTAGTELLDPGTGLSEPGPDLPEPRVSQAAVALADGRVLLVGGFGSQGVLRSTVVYDPGTNRMARGPELGEPRSGAVVLVLPDGSILVAGGYDGRTALASAERLDPATMTFAPTGSLNVARSSHVGVLLQDGRAFVAGGSDAGRTGVVFDSAEVYDPATGTWSQTGDMATVRHKLGAAALPDGRVLVVGGSDERDGRGRYRSAELYDPSLGAFVAAPDMNERRFKIDGAVVPLADGRVLVAGGAPTFEVYDPRTGRFAEVDGRTGADYSFSAAVVLADGAVIVCGGYDAAIRLTAEVLRYTP